MPLKLQVVLVPVANPDASVVSAPARKFLHLTSPESTLSEVCDSLLKRYYRLYPEAELLELEGIQDKDCCDLDPEFTAGDVFASGDILRVLVRNFFPPSLMDASGVYTSQILDVSSALVKRGNSAWLDADTSRFSKRSRTIWAAQPRSSTSPQPTASATNNSVLSPRPEQETRPEELRVASSPVHLPPPETHDPLARLIPLKRSSPQSATKGKRITSGMLVVPPSADKTGSRIFSDNDDTDMDTAHGMFLQIAQPSAVSARNDLTGQNSDTADELEADITVIEGNSVPAAPGAATQLSTNIDTNAAPTAGSKVLNGTDPKFKNTPGDKQAVKEAASKQSLDPKKQYVLHQPPRPMPRATSTQADAPSAVSLPPPESNIGKTPSKPVPLAPAFATLTPQPLTATTSRPPSLQQATQRPRPSWGQPVPIGHVIEQTVLAENAPTASIPVKTSPRLPAQSQNGLVGSRPPALESAPANSSTSKPVPVDNVIASSTFKPVPVETTITSGIPKPVSGDTVITSGISTPDQNLTSRSMPGTHAKQASELVASSALAVSTPASRALNVPTPVSNGSQVRVKPVTDVIDMSQTPLEVNKADSSIAPPLGPKPRGRPRKHPVLPQHKPPANDITATTVDSRVPTAENSSPVTVTNSAPRKSATPQRNGLLGVENGLGSKPAGGQADHPALPKDMVLKMFKQRSRMTVPAMANRQLSIPASNTSLEPEEDLSKDNLAFAEELRNRQNAAKASAAIVGDRLTRSRAHISVERSLETDLDKVNREKREAERDARARQMPHPFNEFASKAKLSADYIKLTKLDAKLDKISAERHAMSRVVKTEDVRSPSVRSAQETNKQLEEQLDSLPTALDQINDTGVPSNSDVAVVAEPVVTESGSGIQTEDKALENLENNSNAHAGMTINEPQLQGTDKAHEDNSSEAQGLGLFVGDESDDEENSSEDQGLEVEEDIEPTRTRDASAQLDDVLSSSEAIVLSGSEEESVSDGGLEKIRANKRTLKIGKSTKSAASTRSPSFSGDDVQITKRTLPRRATYARGKRLGKAINPTDVILVETSSESESESLLDESTSEESSQKVTRRTAAVESSDPSDSSTSSDEENEENEENEEKPAEKEVSLVANPSTESQKGKHKSASPDAPERQADNSISKAQKDSRDESPKVQTTANQDNRAKAQGVSVQKEPAQGVSANITEHNDQKMPTKAQAPSERTTLKNLIAKLNGENSAKTQDALTVETSSLVAGKVLGVERQVQSSLPSLKSAKLPNVSAEKAQSLAKGGDMTTLAKKPLSPSKPVTESKTHSVSKQPIQADTTKFWLKRSLDGTGTISQKKPKVTISPSDTPSADADVKGADATAAKRLVTSQHPIETKNVGSRMPSTTGVATQKINAKPDSTKPYAPSSALSAKLEISHSNSIKVDSDSDSGSESDDESESGSSSSSENGSENSDSESSSSDSDSDADNEAGSADESDTNNSPKTETQALPQSATSILKVASKSSPAQALTTSSTHNSNGSTSLETDGKAATSHEIGSQKATPSKLQALKVTSTQENKPQANKVDSSSSSESGSMSDSISESSSELDSDVPIDLTASNAKPTPVASSAGAKTPLGRLLLKKQRSASGTLMPLPVPASQSKETLKLASGSTASSPKKPVAAKPTLVNRVSKPYPVIKKPLLATLTSLTQRGVPEVIEKLAAGKVKNTKPAKPALPVSSSDSSDSSSESSSSLDSESSDSSGDSDAGSSAFMTLKNLKKPKQAKKKKSGGFLSLMRDVKKK
ncbi:Cdc14 phosphatase binding protein N-terminus [Metschnikowia aff. pulcherrima]|uniref:Cdc14 phosphatase binding protein N-terminus n=1 Tax=Metschnikowia aff. pulcherrima TaxID=2163413 RepID=A0A4P6XIY6_9ASCO|nr:Cdc14 phosphatase binding protein N-terminus [Metschnikowia aff. pulcherrima]